MIDNPGAAAPPSGEPADGVDTSRPHVARMYDRFLGGKDNYAVDRDAVDKVVQVFPEAPATAYANRRFLQRATQYAAEELGIGQFIDLGAGLPTMDATHQVARRVNPQVRVVYVDNDPVVLVHAHALLRDGPSIKAIQADLRHPLQVLSNPDLQDTIDLSQPVAVMLVAVLHFVTDAEDPAELVAEYTAPFAPGSALVLSHVTGDRTPKEKIDRVVEVYRGASAPITFRSHAQITAMFPRWPMVEPGLSLVQQWRPTGIAPAGSALKVYGGMAIKP